MKFYGKYRSIVTDNEDPLMIGRVRAEVPDVLGDEHSGWAMPCAPFSGKGLGFVTIPSVGAGVWIEFENGDLDYPIWSGGWWGSSDSLPKDAHSTPYKKTMIVTEGGQSVVLDDTSGEEGITLETTGGQKIILNPDGIEIDNGKGAKILVTADGIELDNGKGAKVSLSGPKVSVNEGALEVM